MKFLKSPDSLTHPVYDKWRSTSGRDKF